MGNIHPNIKPTGLSQRDLVDVIYMILYSLQGICAKLDNDGGVPLTTYEANCITALFSLIVEDTKGNRWANVATQSSTIPPVQIITPGGISDKALNQFMYQALNCIETLTEQLDTDSLSDSDYEALCYTALCVQRVQNQMGNYLGNGTTFTFYPAGAQGNQRELVDFLYNLFNVLSTLTAKLDADGTVTDTTYKSLWFTATCLLRIENSAGSCLGVSRT